jgi:hypothetical protein
MTKKHFIALADKIKANKESFTSQSIAVLSEFCQEQNNNFNCERWNNYINGICGKNGGKIK